MRGSKNVKTPADPIPIELPVDKSQVSMKDEIMDMVRQHLINNREISEDPETIEEFWDFEGIEDFDPISSKYEVEDMQEEYYEIEAAQPPERLEGASPAEPEESDQEEESNLSPAPEVSIEKQHPTL